MMPLSCGITVMSARRTTPIRCCCFDGRRWHRRGGCEPRVRGARVVAVVRLVISELSDQRAVEHVSGALVVVLANLSAKPASRPVRLLVGVKRAAVLLPAERRRVYKEAAQYLVRGDLARVRCRPNYPRRLRAAFPRPRPPDGGSS